MTQLKVDSAQCFLPVTIKALKLPPSACESGTDMASFMGKTHSDWVQTESQ